MILIYYQDCVFLIEIYFEHFNLVKLINKNVFTCQIAKLVAQKLKNSNKTKNKHNIKNSTELVKHLKRIKVTKQHSITSFCIMNIYANILIDETIDIKINLKNNMKTGDVLYKLKIA